MNEGLDNLFSAHYLILAWSERRAQLLVKRGVANNDKLFLIGQHTTETNDGSKIKAHSYSTMNIDCKNHKVTD